MNKNLLAIVIVIVLLAGIALVWHFYPTPVQPCTFSGWKSSVGVDLDVAVGDVQAVKGKIGITDEQARDFDALMKDFALKYDADCRDNSRGVMNNGEYLCRRKNMDATLDKIRIFLQKIDAAKSLADPGAQKEAVLQSLSELEAAAQSGYKSGCTSSLAVDPHTLTFTGQTTEKTVKLTNAGNNPLTYTTVSVPSGFIAEPVSGPLGPPNLVVVDVVRTLEPIAPERPLTFHVKSNFDEDIAVQIDVDEQNAAVYQNLADQANQATGGSHAPTVEDALIVVNKSLAGNAASAGPIPEATRYFLAAGVLSRAGNAAAAQNALDTATTKNPALAKQPATLILRGVVVNQQGRPDLAAQHFAEAKQATPAQDQNRKALSELLTGAATLKTDQKAATVTLAKPEVQKGIAHNPNLLNFASEQMKVANLDKAVQKAAATAAAPH